MSFDHDFVLARKILLKLIENPTSVVCAEDFPDIEDWEVNNQIEALFNEDVLEVFIVAKGMTYRYYIANCLTQRWQGHEEFILRDDLWNKVLDRMYNLNLFNNFHEILQEIRWILPDK